MHHARLQIHGSRQYLSCFHLSRANFCPNHASHITPLPPWQQCEYCTRAPFLPPCCVCIREIRIPCRLLALHASLYTNIVDRNRDHSGENKTWWLNMLKIDTNKMLEQFFNVSTPGNKWYLDWSWLQSIYPIPIFDIFSPIPRDQIPVSVT